MATVIPAAQQVGGLVTVALVLIIGITLLVGGTAGGWFDGANSDKVSPPRSLTARLFFHISALEYGRHNNLYC